MISQQASSEASKIAPAPHRPVSISIFGSCVTRDALSIAEASEVEVRTYVARQSFIGLADPPLAVDEAWFPTLSAWQRKVACLDANKQALPQLFEDRSDWLLVDFIDERFDLLDIGGTRISNIKEMRAPAFMERYGEQGQPQKRLDEKTLADWSHGLDHFAAQVRAHFRPDRVILHKARWARTMRAADGTIEPFPDAVAATIEPLNALMERYFALFAQALPEARTVEVDPAAIFGDPNHQWSKEPFHYTRDYYLDITGQLRALFATTD